MRSGVCQAVWMSIAVGVASFMASGAVDAGTPQPVTAERVPARSDRPLTSRIEQELQRDPLFKNLNLTVDLYHGLAIVHGSAPNEQMIALLNEKLSSFPGVVAVYNYMTSPERPVGSQSIAVTYEDFARLDNVGAVNNAVSIAERVRERLQADTRLSQFDFSVDSYLGLIILHGNVSTPAQAELAKQIAAHSVGVEDVLSYVSTTGPPPGLVSVTGAPVMTRPAIIRPEPVRFVPLSPCE